MTNETEWNYSKNGCDEEGKILIMSEESGYGCFPVVHKCKLNHKHGVLKK